MIIITVDLYVNYSDNNVVNKDLVGVKMVMAEPVEPCDLEQPHFILNNDSEVLTANYCFVREFDRYYYIDRHTLMSGGRDTITCHIDPLHTYADGIRSLTCNIVRQQNIGINDIPDNLLPLRPQKQVRIVGMGQSPFNIEVAGYNSLNFVLNVAGGAGVNITPPTEGGGESGGT